MKIIRLLTLLLILVSAVISSLVAQEARYNHELLTIEDGLASNEILCGLQDSRGFIWIGTRGGLNRYDGKSFKLLTKRDGLRSNRVVSLTEDESGLIWISYGQLEGTSRPSGEFDIYDPIEGNLIPLSQKIDSRSINKEHIEFIIGDHSKQIYCLADSNKVYKYDGDDKFELIRDQDGSLENKQILRRLYYMYDTYRSEEKYHTEDDISLWSEYLESFISKKNRNLKSFIPIWNNSNADVLLTSNDELYISRNSEFIPISINGDIDNNNINADAFFSDFQGNMWLGTKQGLHKLTHADNRFKSYFTKKDVAGVYGHEVRGIYEDSIGNILAMGYYYDVVENKYYQTDIGNYSLFYPEKKETILALSGSNIYKVKVKGKDSPNRLDITQEKLELSNSIWATFRISNSLFFSSDIHGQTWLCNTNNSKCEIINSCKDSIHFAGDIYKYIYSENDGYYWAAGTNGLYQISDQYCVTDHYGPANTGYSASPIPFYDLRDIYIDEQGIIWLASNGDGLIKWDRKLDEFTSFTVLDGMPSNITYCILPDQYGNLWVSTDNGLASFNKESTSIKSYNESDGIVENEFNRMSSYLAKDGRMFFGGINGLISFDPHDFISDSRDNFLKVEPISYFKYDSKQDILKDFTYELSSKKRIIINPGDLFFQIDYRLLDYNSDKTLYKYRLLGQDKTWQYTTDDHLRFSGLPYGKYELQIQGMDASNIWTKNAMTIPISVVKPWYLRAWVFLFYTFALAGIIYSLYWYQLRRSLQIAEEKNLIEIDQLKTKMYSNITHEFRTPLTVILGMTNQLLEESTPEVQEDNSTSTFKQKVRSSGDSIQRNANRLLGLINQMLDLSKIDSGKMPMVMQSADVVSFISNQLEGFQSFASLNSIQINLYQKIDHLLVNFDEVKLQQIVSNLMSNALKHTPNNGRIDVTISQKLGDQKFSNNNCSIEFFNSGDGISSEELDKIFHRFYQIEGNPHQGTGIGLSLVKEFTELMGGTIDVTSILGEGVSFIIELPISRHADESETNTLQSPNVPSFNVERNSDQIYGGPNDEVDDSKPILLIVEDNKDVAEYIKLCMSDTYNTYVSPDGAQGIKAAIDVIPDIIVSDVMMPHKNGYELTNILKQDVRTSHIPIILLTAKSSQSSLIKGLEDGADAYMTKPFHKKELQVRARKLIEQRELLKMRYAQLISEDNSVSDVTTSPDESIPDSTPISSIDDRFIKSWIDLIEKHYEDSAIEVPFLVSQMSMSRSQLYRKLKALTGYSIAGNIRQYRLKKSKERLAATTDTISEIAYKVGFTDPSYFSKQFSSHYNLSPSEYRKSLLN